MQPYGIRRVDSKSDCCPGHAKFPRESYKNSRSLKAKRKTDRYAHKRVRQWNKEECVRGRVENEAPDF